VKLVAGYGVGCCEVGAKAEVGGWWDWTTWREMRGLFWGGHSTVAQVGRDALHWGNRSKAGKIRVSCGGCSGGGREGRSCGVGAFVVFV